MIWCVPGRFSVQSLFVPQPCEPFFLDRVRAYPQVVAIIKLQSVICKIRRSRWRLLISWLLTSPFAWLQWVASSVTIPFVSHWGKQHAHNNTQPAGGLPVSVNHLEMPHASIRVNYPYGKSTCQSGGESSTYCWQQYRSLYGKLRGKRANSGQDKVRRRLIEQTNNAKSTTMDDG